MPSLARTGVHYPHPGIQEKIDYLFEGEGGIAPVARLVDVAEKTIWIFLQAYWVAEPFARSSFLTELVTRVARSSRPLPCILYGCLIARSA